MINNMRGFIEVKEGVYDDVLAHLRKIKMISCKLIDTLSNESDEYDEDEESEELERSNRETRKSKGRYIY